MKVSDLQLVSQVVVRRAQRQGFVVPREIRDELNRVSLPETCWKEVLKLARPSLSYRNSRYYFIPPSVPVLRNRVRKENRQLQKVQRIVGRMMRQYKKKAYQGENRTHWRSDFVQPVKITTADGRELNFLTRDLGPSGISLLGNCNLLGQKVQVELVCKTNPEDRWFLTTRILWASTVADGLIQQGGVFLDVEPVNQLISQSVNQSISQIG